LESAAGGAAFRPLAGSSRHRRCMHASEILKACPSLPLVWLDQLPSPASQQGRHLATDQQGKLATRTLPTAHQQPIACHGRPGYGPRPIPSQRHSQSTHAPLSAVLQCHRALGCLACRARCASLPWPRACGWPPRLHIANLAAPEALFITVPAGPASCRRCQDPSHARPRVVRRSGASAALGQRDHTN